PGELLDRGLLAVVVMAPAELVERPGDEVRAGHVARLLARVVSIDRVPDKEEEVGAGAGHRPEDRITTLDASAEAAAAEVAAPVEMNARGLVAGGRRHELALDRVPGGPERIAVARRGPEAGERDLDGLAAALGGGRRPSPPRRAARGRPRLHRDGALARRPGPHHRRRLRHLADG